MRLFTTYLNTIITDDYHYPLVDKNTLRLKEDKTNQSVDINLSDSDNVFCFSIDKDRTRDIKGDQVFPFFNPKIEGLCCKNDFILVCQRGKKVTVFLIELKSKTTKGYIKQLQAGKSFFQFIVARIKQCKDDFPEIEGNLNYKCILFHEPRRIPCKGLSKRKKLIFSEECELNISKQTYGKPFYLAQFL